MAIEAPGVHSWTFVAGESLTAKQFHFVKLHTDGLVYACAADTDNPVGILQNKPASGEMAEVMLFGISKLASNAALTAGVYVGTHTDGRGAPYAHGTDTTKYIAGRVLIPSSTAGGIASVIFNCMALYRST